MRIVLLAAALSLLGSALLAHSPLRATTPPNGAVVSIAPEQITMSFQGKIRLTRVYISQGEADGQDLDLGAQTGFLNDFTLPLETLTPGTYFIDWRGLGDDGHVLTGAFQFTYFKP